ncbi:hypothetical protein GA073_19215 [Vibrio alginolyticus]|nr:hypothetical protein [Vibrio alginolyticus]
MEFIKYTKKVHFDGLNETGSIRIGTLKDYQKGEHGEMVADPMEGSKRFRPISMELTSDSIKGSDALSSLIDISEGATVNLVNFGAIIVESNFYIFSVAKDFDDRDHAEWFKEEAYDVAYKINFPKSFFRRVTSVLEKISPVKFLGLFEVHYYDENNGMDFYDKKNGLPAFCLKNYDGFSSQKEIRAVWQPLTNQKISPINLNVEGLKRYTELKNEIIKTSETLVTKAIPMTKL